MLRALHDVPAPAKLNLFLHVVGRRADGYHLLESVFVPVDWSDTLHFERRDDGLLRRHDLGAALPADDLCLRAARLLQSESGCHAGADISVDKQVPWGAGLGGGSSDAASTLLALNRLWGLGWPRRRLLELGARLGADVPFFIGGTPAYVEGIGERLTAIELKPQRFAIVKPPAAIATAELFGHPLVREAVATAAAATARGAAPAATLAGFLAISTGTGLEADLEGIDFGRNDLQPAAQAVCSEVGQALQWLRMRYGNARMTGSGSAVFARIGRDRIDSSDRLSATSDTADSGLSGLPAGWIGRDCESLARHPLRDWADDES